MIYDLKRYFSAKKYFINYELRIYYRTNFFNLQQNINILYRGESTLTAHTRITIV